MRSGVRLGIDVGDVRIGVAESDPAGSIATPVETVQRGPGDLQRLAAIVAERQPIEVVLGLPRSLSGAEGPAARRVRGYADALAAAIDPVPLRLIDERLTTVTAERQLRGTGRKGARRRAVVDQAAAVVILQYALDAEQSSGAVPGETLDQGLT
jgi:putative Holliday junction resolvase